jgi:hypothetical protein
MLGVGVRLRWTREYCAGVWIPHPNCAIIRARDDVSAVGRECN